MRTRLALVLKEQTHIATTGLTWTAVILNRKLLVNHFPMIGHLKCTVKAVYIISFGGQKGIRVNTSNPLAYRPAVTEMVSEIQHQFKCTKSVTCCVGSVIMKYSDARVRALVIKHHLSTLVQESHL